MPTAKLAGFWLSGWGTSGPVAKSDSDAGTVAQPPSGYGTGTYGSGTYGLGVDGEAVQIFVLVSASDVGSASEAPSIFVAVASSDSGTSTPSTVVGIAATDTGTSTGAVVSIQPGVASDLGAASEVTAIKAASTVTDSGTATPTVSIALAVSDASTGSDSGQAWLSLLASIPPDGVATNTNLAGAYTDVDDDPDAPDAAWMTAITGGAGTNIRYTLAQPPGTALKTGAGLQEFRVLVRSS